MTTTTTPANAPGLTSITDDALALETLAAQRIINLGGRDREHFNQPTREEGLRRLHKVGHALAGQVEELAREVARQLARGEGDVSTDTLTRYAALFALATPDHPALDHLATVIAAPPPAGESDPWGFRTDAEAVAEKSDRGQLAEDARARLIVLTDEIERRRLIVEAEREAERLARYVARRSA